MKVVIAPDSFKGSLSAIRVAECIENGIREVNDNMEIIKIPMADGGEGTVQALVYATSGELINVKVKGPLLKQVEAFYGILGDKKTAIIEMASASGLPLLSKEDRNPMLATTYGTGELIRDALDKGCRSIMIGIGGSATNDGGAGMAKALGVKFLDENDCDIGFGGGSLNKLHRIDVSGLDERIKDSEIIAACDVDNPLCGSNGASFVYGKQKGADDEMVKLLDENLMHYANIVKRDTGISILDKPGAGAAGGLGGGLLAFMNVELRSGIDIVIKATGLEEKIIGADLVITGEGMIDFQTCYGKTPYGVAKLAQSHNIPVVAIAGGIGEGADKLYSNGFDSIFSIVDKPMTLEEAMEHSEDLLKKAAERIIRLFICKQNKAHIFNELIFNKSEKKD